MCWSIALFWTIARSKCKLQHFLVAPSDQCPLLFHFSEFCSRVDVTAGKHSPADQDFTAGIQLEWARFLFSEVPFLGLFVFASYWLLVALDAIKFAICFTSRQNFNSFLHCICQTQWLPSKRTLNLKLCSPTDYQHAGVWCWHFCSCFSLLFELDWFLTVLHVRRPAQFWSWFHQIWMDVRGHIWLLRQCGLGAPLLAFAVFDRNQRASDVFWPDLVARSLQCFCLFASECHSLMRQSSSLCVLEMKPTWIAFQLHVSLDRQAFDNSCRVPFVDLGLDWFCVWPQTND